MDNPFFIGQEFVRVVDHDNCPKGSIAKVVWITNSAVRVDIKYPDGDINKDYPYSWHYFLKHFKEIVTNLENE